MEGPRTDYFDLGRKGVINNLVWVYEKIAAGPARERFKDDDVFAYERVDGSHLLAAINDNESSDRTVRVATVSVHPGLVFRPTVHAEAAPVIGEVTRPTPVASTLKRDVDELMAAVPRMKSRTPRAEAMRAVRWS